MYLYKYNNIAWSFSCDNHVGSKKPNLLVTKAALSELMLQSTKNGDMNGSLVIMQAITAIMKRNK